MPEPAQIVRCWTSPTEKTPSRCVHLDGAGVRAATSASAAAASARTRRNENIHADLLQALLFVAYFNAGVRAVDIRDPFHPKEIGVLHPARRPRRPTSAASGRAAAERCKTAIQTNNVEVDDRGYIYIVDRANTGMHILELTGAARRIAAGR